MEEAPSSQAPSRRGPARPKPPLPTADEVTHAPRLVLFVVLPFLLAIVLAAVVGVRSSRKTAVRIAGGSPGGLTRPVASALEAVLVERAPSLRPSLLDTGGTVENAGLLDKGEADVGIVQPDAKGRGLRTVAPLYSELLQVVVRGDVRSLADLRGKRVAAGPEGSGTRQLAVRLLGQEGIADGKGVTLVAAAHADAADAFARREVDAAFVLAGMPTPAVARMLEEEGAELLELGEATPGGAIEGLLVAAPYFRVGTVPSRVYGRKPARPTGTLASDALLVAREGLDADAVQELTRALFEAKAELVDAEPALAQLTEKVDTARLRFPLHEGAAQYYQRDQKPFIVEWADVLSLGLSVALLGWSGVSALGRWRTQRKKDRVDRYYLEVQALGDRLDEATTEDEVLEVRDGLKAIRRKAFAELAAERLAANESFTIFQDYLRSELLEVEAALRELREAPRP